jgi:hypothetical protein
MNQPDVIATHWNQQPIFTKLLNQQFAGAALGNG